MVEGGDITLQDEVLHHLDAAMIVGEPKVRLKAEEDAELLFVVVGLK